jgi:hypothetical protein
MQCRKWLAAGAAAPALVTFLLGGISAADSADDPTASRKEIRAGETMFARTTIPDEVSRMATAVGLGRKVDRDAAAFFKVHEKELLDAMGVFKPRQPGGEGGLGVGEPGKYDPDGIEHLMLNQLRPRTKMTLDLRKHGADLNRLADVTIAVAEITHHYIPKQAAPGQNLHNWTRNADRMKEGAEDLKAAVKARQPGDVKQAFQAICSACSACHTEFR